MKILVKNGTIVDGSGGAQYAGNVAVEDAWITAVGQVEGSGFDQVIDAGGMAISPGFIDTHSHSDLQVLVNPYVEPKIRQGITTELLGQDRISMAPLPQKYVSPWRKNLAGLEGDSDRIDWSYGTTEGYLRLLQKSGVGLNEAYLVPHGNIRMEAMGLDNRQPTAVELEQMRAITRREMEAGAYGLSSGLIYMPCAYAHA
jgi:N-acyl-D-amino-acid deacylase